MSGNPFAIHLERDLPRSLRREHRGFRGDVHELEPERTVPERTLRLVALLLGVLLLALGTRVVALTVLDGDRYRALAETNRLRREPLPALRGAVVDRFGAVLADNEPAYAIDVLPNELPEDPAHRERTVDRIAQETGTERSVLDSVLVSGSAREPIRSGVPEAEALTIASRLADEPAVAVVARAVRRYRSEGTAPILGYVGRVTAEDLEARPDLDPTSTVGRTGLESRYDAELRGTDGYRTVERDSANQSLRVLGTLDPRPGDTLQLTIDGELQAIAASALATGVRRVGSTGGALVALDPTTGGVLALASFPSYDPTALSRGLDAASVQRLFSDPAHPFLNRATSGEYPSGSTAKPIIAAEALERGIITPTTTVLSTGGITVGGDTFPDWRPGGHGLTAVRSALADSVNTFFYYIGGGYDRFRGLGLSGLLEGFERFGLGSRTGIDLPGEATGYLPTDAVRAQRGTPWYLGDTYHLSIGQGPFAVTPLQIANATAAIANGGTLYRPFLVASATGADGRTRVVHAPEAIRTPVVSASAVRTVQEGMRQAVTDGSARALADLALPFAGKTGTAQYGDGSRTHAWFTAFGPYRDARIAITVLIEGGGEGHAAALPVAHTVLRWWTEHRGGNP